MIEDFYINSAEIYVLSVTKTDGRIVRTYVSSNVSFPCAIYSQIGDKVVRLGKIDYTVNKTLYCAIGTPIKNGDILLVDGSKMMIVSIVNTNNQDQHLVVSLSYNGTEVIV